MKETSPLYRNLTLAAFAFTAALDVGGFFAVSALVDHFKTSIAGAEELGWFVDAVAGVAKLSLDTTVLLVAPILGLSLVQILLPMLGESLFMEALAKESRVYADRLEACSGLPAQDAVLASLGRAALLLRYRRDPYMRCPRCGMNHQGQCIRGIRAVVHASPSNNITTANVSTGTSSSWCP